MAHSHAHSHGKATGKILIASLAVTLVFVAVEAAAGLRSGSLSLLSDAGHNFTDALALSQLELWVKDENSGETYQMPVHRQTVSRERITITGTAQIDPKTLAFGSLRSGEWTLLVLLRSCAWSVQDKLRVSEPLPKAAKGAPNGGSFTLRLAQRGGVRLIKA